MKRPALLASIILFTALAAASATVRFVDLNSSNPTVPFTEWSSAATNIQDAIDASSEGDLIWVTNGIYATGGKVMAGDLTNRVTLDKALTVQSVNGPGLTVIQGAWDPATTNGPLAVRCAWMTNGATLAGFTLQGGATRASGAVFTLESGGGIWCASSNALVLNCIIQSNAATSDGGGVYLGTIRNSVLQGNWAPGSGSAYLCNLASCTIVSNLAYGTFNCAVTNCIVYFNTMPRFSGAANYSGGRLSFCCTTPLPSGVGNIATAPQLLPDGIHLASTSPCRGAGTNVVTGTDIDGQPWANPPSIGCDEWLSEPVVTMAPQIQFSSYPVGFNLTVVAAGQEPFTCWWTKDGAPIADDAHWSASHTTNLAASGISLDDAGAYQVAVSNASGMTTSIVAQLVIHCVDAANSTPTAPYLDWASAATNIQDAIDAALPGELVLVTNGIYTNGGRAIGGDLTNRVALNKALLVESVNGPTLTMIQGAWDPATTNGPLAVRCAWLTNGAVLSGFTLEGGATRVGNSSSDMQGYGGGAWGASSTNATVVNCVLAGNAAAKGGGGVYQAKLIKCTLSSNSTPGSGGGADSCNLTNCFLNANFANLGGGGAAFSNLRNCAVTHNQSPAIQSSGGAVYLGTAVNCTISSNSAVTLTGYGLAGVYSAKLTNCLVFGNRGMNYDSLSTLAFCCATPLASGAGNIAADPQLLPDGIHLGAASPCIGAGTNSVVSGTDIDGQPWANPPSMGCDEWLPVPLVTVAASPQLTGPPLGLVFSGAVVAGQGPFAYSWLKDGGLLVDGTHFTSTQTPNLTLNGFGPGDAGAYQVVASNAFGMATSVVAQVVVHCADAAGVNPTTPYSDWTTAATNIQDAIDAAGAGDFVLVTNGLYASGGRVMAGDLTNRVAVTQPLTLSSVNGSAFTTIQGAWDPATNGPGAVRCAWVADGAILNAFTLEGGATRNTGDQIALQSGGGVWASPQATLTQCVICTNAANYGGGGVYGGLVQNCRVLRNTSNQSGGGAYASALVNSAVVGNWAVSLGGGIWQNGGGLNHCTVSGNFIKTYGGAGGLYGNFTSVTNSIVSGNWEGGSPLSGFPADSYGAVFYYSCSFPLSGGASNISSDPQLMDGIHLATTSPCRGAGTAANTSGIDIDGEPWTNPPSMGCDEVWPANIKGPLSVSAVVYPSPVVQTARDLLSGLVTGWASRVAWFFSDGSFLTNASELRYSHIWTNPGDYTITFTAYNADNPGGVSTNLGITVLPLVSPTVSVGGLSGSNFSLSFTSQPGIYYIVEQTTNLAPPVTWQTISTGYGNGTNMQIADSSATNAMRFYRVLAQ